MRTIYRRSAHKISIVAASIGLAFSAQAQDKNLGAEQTEVIEITGSRILREGAVSPSPVTVISGEQLTNSGALNIGEALNNLPQLANTYNLSNSGRYIGTAGLNILDLRGMGTSRTLVLVNGKRHVSSSPGQSSVDTNTIPSSWIEKVEVITGGASAVYGSDAVTGVVNFILKKNVEGLDVSATAGTAESSGYTNQKINFSYGSNFDNDKGNAAISIEYSGQDKMDALENPWTATAFRNMPNQNQPSDQLNNPAFPDKIYTENASYYAINEQGVFAATNGYLTNSFNEDGTLKRLNIGDNYDFTTCADCDNINLNKYSEIQPKFDRVNVNAKVNYDITDDHRFYSEAKFAKTSSTVQGQPSFFFFNPLNSIKRTNAYLSDDVAQVMDDNGASSITLNRFNNDLGRRIEDVERTTIRAVAGIEGYVFEDWKYDLSFNHGQTKTDRTNHNSLIMDNYFNAIDAVEDVDGNIVCADATAQANGCLPLNIMGSGHADEATLNYLRTSLLGTSTIKQTVISASVSNADLYELPAGYLSFATGFEYRKEQSEQTEPEEAAGTFFNSLGEDKGEFNVKEAFVEFSVPVLADEMFADELSIDAAARIAKYSTTGTSTSWKLGLNWTVNDEFRLRATKSAAIRAPNISELFGAPSETYFSVDDPCKSSELGLLDDATTRTANCLALGVSPSFNSNYDDASVEGTNSGNREVQPEESRSLTIGAVITPNAIDNLAITLDYWDIELEDAIDAIDAQTILDRCVDSESGVNNQYCSLITRDSNSEIIGIQNSVLNVAGQRARGIDLEVSHKADLLGGTLSSSFIATYMIERKDFPFQQDKTTFDNLRGTDGNGQIQANFNLNYEYEDYFASTSTRYIDAVSLYTDQEFALNANPSDLVGYDTYITTDVTFGYKFESGVKATVGIDNFFNQPLPYGTNGTTAESGDYDNIGRFFYTTVSYSF